MKTLVAIIIVVLIVGSGVYVVMQKQPPSHTISEDVVRAPQPSTSRCWNGVCFVPPQGWSVRTEAPHKLVYASPDFVPFENTGLTGPASPQKGYLLQISLGSGEDAEYTEANAHADETLTRLKGCAADVCEEFHKQIVADRPYIFMKSGRSLSVYGLYKIGMSISYSESSTDAPAIFSSFLKNVSFETH